MKVYSTAEIAKILDVTPAWIRSQARRSLVKPARTSRGHFRYSFQDIVLLRTTRLLENPHMSARRIRRALRSLATKLGAGRSLASLRLRSEGEAILAMDGIATWDAETGQTVLDFGSARPASTVSAIAAPRLDTMHAASAADWFNRALELERESDYEAAQAAYREACRVDPTHVHSRINLGRLCHSAQAVEDAERLYREALSLDPEHPIALFNLGVVLEDQGLITDAIDCYKGSIAADPEIAEAHYNLARLYARHREESAAVRHFSRYKALTRKKD
jgi:tetratricopeptide (TPR) repeat protein